jgi:hypothetical protein
LVISVLGAVSAASVLGAAGLTGHWLMHQRDSLGRPRSFPVWSVALLVLLAVVAAVPGVRRRGQERTLSSVASVLVGHRVSVHCQSFGKALSDVGSELGYVRFTPSGPEPSTLIKRDPCAQLRRYASGRRSHPSFDEVVAVHVLTHESMHMKGLLNEAKAECAAIQRDEQTAELLGATAGQARELARDYWLEVYPRMPDEYRDNECAPGGHDDEQLSTAPWTVVAP